MAVYDTSIDQETLNILVGKAMLYDELCAALLMQKTRPHVLQAFRLSKLTQQYLVNLPDMPDLCHLAQNIHGYLG